MTTTYPNSVQRQPVTRDAAVNRAFPCAACKNKGNCSVCMTLYVAESKEVKR